MLRCATVALKVIRPTPATVLATSPLLTVPAPRAVVTADVQVPVQPGDTVGAWYGNDTTCGVPGSAADTYSVASAPSNPPAGPITGEILTGGTGARFSFAARLEADADGDGFGDETQDACPADPTTSSAPCEADVHLTRPPRPPRRSSSATSRCST